MKVKGWGDCGFQRDPGGVCGYDGTSCPQTKRPAYTEEQLAKRKASTIDTLLTSIGASEIEWMLGKKLTPREREKHVEFERTHNYVWVTPDHCPLRDGAVTVELEEA